MKKLNDSTVKLISSSYVISSIECAIKELVENSIDAYATRIFINLKRFGLDKIEIIDDGCGFSDASLICQRYCTSKISDFSDIETVNTFGFRGEVLSSICAISNLSIMSKSTSDSSELGHNWVFDKMGNILAQSVAQCKQGTTITVSNIFHNLPVRCQMYKSLFVLQKALKLITINLQHLYLSRRNIHIKLLNDNKVVLNLPITSSRKDAISFVIGPNKFKYFNEILKSEKTNDNHELSLNLFIPSCVDDKLGLTHHDYKENCFLFVNDRPVEVSLLFKSIRTIYNQFTNQNISRYPSMVLYLTLPTSWVDVNIDPEKRKIKLSNMVQISDFVQTNLKQFYDSLANKNNCELSVVNDDPSTNKSTSSNVPSTTYVRTIKPSKINEISNLFSSADVSLTEESKEKESNKIIHTNQNEIHLKKEIPINFKDFALGICNEIVDHPVRNENLKRATSDINDDLTNKRTKIENCSAKLTEPNIIGKDSFSHSTKNSSSNIKCLVNSCLYSLDDKSESVRNLINANNNLTIVACWDSFIICNEFHSSDDKELQGTQDLVIFNREHFIFTSIYFVNISRMQIPAFKLSAPYLIDNSHGDLVENLLKLPVQLIYNKITGDKFNVISCPHLIKNGYRIHHISNNDSNCFEIITKPDFVDDNIMVDEIRLILAHSTDSSNIVRTRAGLQWIYSTSQSDTKLKIDNEIKNLTGKRLNEFYKCCMSNINRCRLSQRLDEHLPELFRVSLNKC